MERLQGPFGVGRMRIATPHANRSRMNRADRSLPRQI